MSDVYTIVGYTFQADLYCPRCIVETVQPSRTHGRSPHTDVELVLNAIAEDRGIDRNDEWTFDTDVFPKVVFAGDVVPERDVCASCEEYLDNPWE